MAWHPYRSPATLRAPNTERSARLSGGDDRIVAIVLVLVGALGVLVGIVGRQCSVELSLGLSVLFFVARAELAERADARIADEGLSHPPACRSGSHPDRSTIP